jgi:hypothetical protein
VLVFFGPLTREINQGRSGVLETIFPNLFHTDARGRLPSLHLDLALLGTVFHHQLEDYKFVSFYSDTDLVNTQKLSIFGADSLKSKCR